jgi:hypothetical protein
VNDVTFTQDCVMLSKAKAFMFAFQSRSTFKHHQLYEKEFICNSIGNIINAFHNIFKGTSLGEKHQYFIVGLWSISIFSLR